MVTSCVPSSPAVTLHSLRQGSGWERQGTNHIKISGCYVPFRQPVNDLFNTLKSNNSQRLVTYSSCIGDIVEPLLSKYKSSVNKSKYSATTPKHENISICEQDDHPISYQSYITKKIDAFQKFCRLYSIIGTVIGTLSVSLLPLQAMSDLSLTFFIGTLKAMICMALINLYTVGINQLYDVELDKVNKPYLPLASGEISIKTGAAIVSIASSISIVLGLMSYSPALLCTILIFFFIGSAYSIDKYILGKPLLLTPSIIFTTTFMCIFTFVIGVLKDIPDVEGDKAFGMKNLTILIGKEKVFWLSTYLIMIAYGVAIVVGASLALPSSKLITVIGHFALALIFWIRAQSVNLSNDMSTSSFYQFIWNLSYVEYLLVLFVR